MVLAEALGRRSIRDRVKIYATDVDEDALDERASRRSTTRSSSRPSRRSCASATSSRRTRATSFRADLRRTVIFGRNDLVQDAPISRVDLLICRNTLMYFTPEAQTRILEPASTSRCATTGVLVVGKSEMLVKQTELFRPLDVKLRIFRKLPRRAARERYAFVLQPGDGDPSPAEAAGGFREAAIDASPVAQIVVDAAGNLVFANLQARTAFRLTGADVGRPLQDLEVSYRPAELRPTIEQAFDQRRPVPDRARRVESRRLARIACSTSW